MQKRKNARWFRYALVVAVLAGLGTMALWPTALKVEAGKAELGPVREVLEAQGITRLQHSYVVSAPVSGQLRRIHLRPGDPVKTGQTVAIIDAVTAADLDARSRSTAEAQLNAAKASLSAAMADASVAQSTAAQADSEARRLRPLADQGMVSASAMQAADTQLRQAKLAAESASYRVSVARAQVTSAQVLLHPARLAKTADGGLAVPSPADGLILRRHVESAGVVQMGTPLLELGDPEAMEVAVDVLSADAVRLNPGMPVELLRTGTGRTLSGKVRRIEPGAFTKVSALGVDEQRVWVVIDLLSPRDEWRGLGDGYRVQARFVVAQADNAVRIPSSAVFRRSDGMSTFRIVDGRARLTTVTPGLSGEGWLAIASGLQQGDAVVVHPPAELEDGARVKVP